MEDNNDEDQLESLLDAALDDLLEGDKEESAPDTPDSSIKTPVAQEAGDIKFGLDHQDQSGQQGGSRSASQNLGLDEEEMNKFFENMSAQLKAELPKFDPEQAKTQINESMPQIFGMMQSLLSKELLYPALKDLSPKFDEWLKKNSKNLSKADLKKYKRQRNVINEIIDNFDDESIDDQTKFDKNLDLMERMQSYGAPPEELTVPGGVGGGKCPVV